MGQSVPHLKGHINRTDVENISLDAGLELNLVSNTLMQKEFSRRINAKSSFVNTSGNATKDRAEGIPRVLRINIHGVETNFNFLVMMNVSYNVLLGAAFLSQVNGRLL